MKTKNSILDSLLIFQNKETWVEDINDIIYGYSRAVLLYAAMSDGGQITIEDKHVFYLKRIIKAFNENDKFNEVLFSEIDANNYYKIINEIICHYSIAVISTVSEIEHERTSTHLLILKDLGDTFYKSIPD